MTSYTSHLKSFRRIRKKHKLSSYAVDLYLILLGECGSVKWKNPFFVSSKNIIEETGMSKPTLCKARRELKESNLIDFKDSPGGKIPTKYKLLTVNVANGEATPTVNDIYGNTSTVSEINGRPPLTVNVANGEAKENPPTPPKENIYNINKPVEGESAPAPTRTREGQNFIDNLKRDPLWQEEAMRACAGVEDSFDGLCLRVVQQWEAFGEDFNARDARKKFRNWLIKEAESLRRERLTQVSRPPIEERRKAFQMEIADVRSQRLDADNRPLYNVRICNDFFSYWTETAVDAPDVMRFEREAFWETSKRLAAWKEREKTRL